MLSKEQLEAQRQENIRQALNAIFWARVSLVFAIISLLLNVVAIIMVNK